MWNIANFRLQNISKVSIQIVFIQKLLKISLQNTVLEEPLNWEIVAGKNNLANSKGYMPFKMSQGRKSFFFFNWNIVDLQCVSFRCTAKWFICIHMYISIYPYVYIYCIYLFFFRFFSIIGYYYNILNIVPCAIE